MKNKRELAEFLEKRISDLDEVEIEDYFDLKVQILNIIVEFEEFKENNDASSEESEMEEKE